MGQTSASKQRHIGRLERSDALKEVRERPFPADGVAYQQGHKVNRFITAEAASYEADLLCKSLEQSLRRQVTGNHDDFGEPCRHRRTIKRRGLDLNTGIGYHRERPPCERMVCYLLIRDLSFLFTLVRSEERRV